MSEDNKKQEISERIVATKKWHLIYLGAIVVCVLVAIATVWAVSNPGFGNRFTTIIANENTIGNDNQLLVCEDCQADLLTGMVSENKSGYPIAVVIDNHLDARPAFGLDKAKLVYEAPVEGGITRYLAVFDSNQEKDIEIGPVRSARPYFVNWAQSLSALFVHCGGSPQALVDIAKENVFDLNQFYNDKYFWRSEDKAAPHNVMTSLEKLQDFLQNSNSEAKFFSWQFVDQAQDHDYSQGSNEIITIDYPPSYAVKWSYDWNKSVYARNLDGQPHFSAQDNLITAKTVIIQEVQTEVLDAELRLDLQTSGEGKAIICSEGLCQTGIWKKNNDYSRLRYYVDGQEFKFNLGNFWIEIVDQNVDYSF